MKKIFFYMVVALCVGFAMTSCGDDDDDNKSDAKYKTEKYVNGATSYHIDEGVLREQNNNNTSLTGVNLTESGKVVVEVVIDGKKHYVTYDGELQTNDVIVLIQGGKQVGKIQKLSSRAGVSLTINLTVNIPGYGNMTFTSNDPVQAVEMAQTVAGNLVATWNVDRMKITLDFDEKTDASAETKAGKGGDLNEFLKLAKDNDVKLTADEEAQLKKEIVSITIDGFKLFSIQYKDGTTDAAEWKGNSSLEELTLSLKESEMGNKFLNSKSVVDIEYPGNNKIVLKIQSRLEEDKCTATLTVNLSK